MTRLRSLDLSNNLLNESSVDQILSDLRDNLNTVSRGGVTINLGGTGNSPPSSIVITTPTSTQSKIGEETLAVNQTDPNNLVRIFQLQNLDIDDSTTGTEPNTIVNYARLYQDTGSGVFTEVTFPNNTIQLDYTGNQIEYNVGSEPVTGTQLKVEQYQIVNGEISTIEGGITIKTELNNRGWTVITN